MPIDGNPQNQLFVVVEGELEWLAWRQWMKSALGWKFFPKRMTVLDPWPPTTKESAERVAAIFQTIRNKNGGPPLPNNPMPWSGDKSRLCADKRVVPPLDKRRDLAATVRRHAQGEAA